MELTRNNYVIFGYGYEGVEVAKILYNLQDYNFCGFVDNNECLHGYYSYDRQIMSFGELMQLYDALMGDLSIIVVSKSYEEIINQCEDNGLIIDKVWMQKRLIPYPFRNITFQDIDFKRMVRLYAGDIGDPVHMNDDNLYALSITHSDDKHILHDITKKYPLPDNCIDVFEAENVFEFIDKEKKVPSFNEIYRILKPKGIFRLSLPDYNSPYMLRRCMRDTSGNVIYDPGENRTIKWGKDGFENGYIDFTTYESINAILNESNFTNINWLRFYDKNGVQCRKYVDQSIGYCHRISNEKDSRDFNILVDCIK